MSRGDRDAKLEIVAKGVAEQVVAMLKKYYSSNREQAVSRMEQ